VLSDEVVVCLFRFYGYLGFGAGLGGLVGFYSRVQSVGVRSEAVDFSVEGDEVAE
jgi:hypothetical protein